MIRVLIVDDHELLRAAIRSRLERAPDISVVGDAATANQALARASELHPDVVLLDLLLASRSGDQVIPDLLRRSPRSRVLVVSAQAAPSSVQRALSAGAAGYLPKRASDRELPAAIRRIADGEGHVGAMPALEPLSARERDVLHLLALGHLSREIAARLFVSTRTVETHRAHIMLKLNLQTRAELVTFALANGVIAA